MKLNMLLNYPLGANNAPIGLNKKEIWPAIIGAIGAIAGAGIAAVSSSSANETNRDIAEGVNEANKSINDTQLQYAKEQYSRERLENRFLVDQSWQREIENRTHQEQYNSPAAQIARLRDAGINPILAMQNGGSLGSVSSSASSTTGQQAKGSQPSLIPMQTGAPMQAYTGFGNGISNAVAAYYSAKDAERKDYELASDITFRDNAQRQKTLDQLIEIKNSGVQSKWIDAQIEHLFKSLQFERDKFERQKVVEDANISIEKFRSETERYATQIQEMLASSQVELSRSQCMRIASEISSTEQQVKDMIANGISQRRINDYIAKREKEAARMAEIERKNMDYSGNKSIEKHVRAWKKTMDILFQPIKGLVSVGIR